VPWFDLPPAELAKHRTSATEPDGLDGFWAEAIAAARARASEPAFVPYREEVYGAIAVDDVTFSGADGSPVRAWFLRPRAATVPLACLVRFIGYGGGRALPVHHLDYAAAGHATFVMDTRGQGGQWSPGATGDPVHGTGPEHPGVLSRGVADPASYYYRRLYLDAVRAVETAAAHPQVDEARLAVGGMSQGGALSLAAAALLPGAVRLCHADVPFMCDIERALTLASEHPYLELVAFLHQHPDLVETARRTLRHVDCALLAARIRARCVLSVGLMDGICPPSTVYAAYNAITAAKELLVYPYGAHDVSAAHHERLLADFAAEMAV